MKNALFLIIAVMTITLLGCQRNQKVNTSKNEFCKDSCLRVTFADDTVEYRYQLITDNIEIKMLDSVQIVFLSDIQKHGPFNFRDVHVTDDIIEYCRGKSFNVCDSMNYTIYKFQFVEKPLKFTLGDKLSVTQESVIVSGTKLLGRIKVE